MGGNWNRAVSRSPFLSPRGTSGERTEERGNHERRASSPQPSPPSDGREGESQDLETALELELVGARWLSPCVKPALAPKSGFHIFSSVAHRGKTRCRFGNRRYSRFGNLRYDLGEPFAQSKKNFAGGFAPWPPEVRETEFQSSEGPGLRERKMGKPLLENQH